MSSVFKDHPPNIVEFYGAALLPSFNSTKMQLFLELMPCEIVIILCGWVGGNDWVRDTIIILICLIFVTWLNKKHLRTSTRLPVIKLNNARV